MEPEFWIGQLGRIYKEANSHEGATGVTPLAEQFNEVLESLKEEFSSNEVVQSTETIDVPPKSVSPGDVNAKKGIRDEIQIKSGQLADALGYNLPEENLQHQETPMNVVHVNQEQTSNQTVQQTVTVESTMKLINHLSRDADATDELREIVNKFQEELETGEPDESHLRTFIKQAGKKSPEVAANLGILALQRGIIDILGL